MRNYDVVIAGASFAGLAVASRIKNGKVLLLDSKPIGTAVKSACGTLFFMLSELGLEDCAKQVHRKIILHTSPGNLVYNLATPFCVIDGERFCQRLFQKEETEFIKARVLGFDGKTLRTDKGNFQAKILVDASGWGAVLSKKPEVSIGFHPRGGPGRTPRVRRDLSSGLETILTYQEEGLHFWYEPKILPFGIFWLFPQGETSRFGVGSYQGRTNLKPYLDEFLARFGLKAGKLHGGYFPHRLRKPVEGKIFRVGDAAGQCLSITGEGIRPAIFFGQKCGEVIEEILLGKISLEQGLKRYQDFVLKRKIFYELLYWLQSFLINIPESLFYPLAWLVGRRPVTNFVLNNYLRILKDG